MDDVLLGRARVSFEDLPHDFQGHTDLARRPVLVVAAVTVTPASGIAPPVLVPVDVSHRGSFGALLVSVAQFHEALRNGDRKTREFKGVCTVKTFASHVEGLETTARLRPDVFWKPSVAQSEA